MDLAEETLVALFDAGATVLTERFVSPDDPLRNREAVDVPAPPAPPTGALVESFRLTLDGEDHAVPIAPGETLLEAALAAGIDAPCSCTEGHCGTCMSWLRSGEVSMAAPQALSKRNIEKGWILACQSRPSSDTPIWLDFDI
jgi:ferredoxin